MNQCRKMILLSLLLVAQITTVSYTQEVQTTAEVINTTIERIQNMPSSLINLPSSDFLWAGGCALLGAAIGHISTSALIQLLDPEMKPAPRFFQAHKWNTSQWLGTVGGAAVCGSLSLAYSSPKAHAARINRPLLIAVITAQPSNLTTILDKMYVSDQFARAAAFKDLNTLRITLTAILESFTKIKGTPGYSEAKNLTPAIVSYITIVKDAMLTIKNDPQWLAECNAFTLAMGQANIQSCQNSQLATTVIQLAHLKN
jgi:hypothetical protein